jgi:dienelactone hydrolase
MFISTSVLALNPSRKYEALPSDYGMQYEEKSIPTEDELITLKAWFFKPAESSKRVIILSDDGEGNMADNITLISQFLSLGYNVLAYDYRGFGESSDFNINNKFYIYNEFQKDLTAVINYVRKYHATLTVLDIYGKGMGAGISIAVACNNTNVKNVIADSPYYSLSETKQKYKETSGTMYLMPLGYIKNTLEPKYALAEKGKHLYGILIICGEIDPISGPMDYKSYSKGAIPKMAVEVIPGVPSQETFTSNEDRYFETIKKFLKL